MKINICILFFIASLTSYSQKIYYFDTEFVYETRKINNDKLINITRFYCSSKDDTFFLMEKKVKNKAITYSLFDFEKKLFFDFKTNNLFDSNLDELSNSIYGILGTKCDDLAQDEIIEKIKSNSYSTTHYLNKAKNRYFQKIDFYTKKSKNNHISHLFWKSNLFRCITGEIHGIVTKANIYNSKGKKISVLKLISEKTLEIKINTSLLIKNMNEN